MDKFKPNLLNPELRPEQFEAFCEHVYKLASIGMSSHETASALHTSAETIALYPESAIAFRKGRAEFALALRKRAHEVATEDSAAYDDPQERIAVRRESNAMMKKLLDYVEADKLPSIEVIEATRRLSNEELDERIQAKLDKAKQANGL